MVARKIAARRKYLGLNSDDVAHDALINRSHYSDIERGKVMPSQFTIMKIATVLNLNLVDLLTDAYEEVQQFIRDVQTDEQ
ncbi:helix-turn-helix domain-containing protein [Alkalihalobacillus sp. BA299]|uniref:helix-turn-helix domain-containing protein n=1 Tax=Alkalihalobacillus sp. BA299 TaxID=2815938 RepID=UPI001ADC0B9D|nr:helix-turn-helix transcriptional regulator [Alkalihalobacillus sp. BA299]